MGSLSKRIGGFIRKGREISPSPPLSLPLPQSLSLSFKEKLCELTGRSCVSICNLGRKPSPEANNAGILISNFQHPELFKTKIQLSHIVSDTLLWQPKQNKTALGSVIVYTI